MRTLVTGIRNRPGHRIYPLKTMRKSRFGTGFTLIEILVVIVIVGTVLSIAMISFGILGDDRDLQTEARRFVSLVEVARDEASLQSREFGIELMTTGYRFVEFDGLTGLWADVPGDDTLRLRDMPDDVELELYLEGKRIVLDDDPAEFEDPDESPNMTSGKSYAPHLLIYSSGDTTPFELHVWRAFDDERVILRGNAFGETEVVSRDDE